MAGRPSQVVILAGGRGERLRPLTDRVPKPMIEFHGRPFLGYLLEMLAGQGFTRVLVLLGHLADVVVEGIGDGRRWGVEVTYSISEVGDDTGRRLRIAAPELDPCFLLMYCDNYWPMRFSEMWSRFACSGARGMVTVYANADGYSKSNVAVDGDGFVTAYDRSRAAPGLNGVEIGYAIMTKPVLDLLPDGNPSFEATVLPELVRRRELAAYVTEHRYYSVGSPERLPRTEAFLARRPIVLLDRDGVLSRRPPRGEYVRTWAEFEWLPGALGALRLFKDGGYRIAVLSNQAGIGRGAMTGHDLEAIHERMRSEARAAGGDIDAFYWCPHGWDDGCACRKPRPGLFYRAQRDFDADLTHTWYIGDDERDEHAAEAAGCRSLLVGEGADLLDAARAMVEGRDPRSAASAVKGMGR